MHSSIYPFLPFMDLYFTWKITLHFTILFSHQLLNCKMSLPKYFFLFPFEYCLSTAVH